LSRDQDRVGSGQCIHGQQPQRRRAVDQHIVVVLGHAPQGPRKPPLALLNRRQLESLAGAGAFDSLANRIANGKFIRQGAIGDLPTEHASTVRTSDPQRLVQALNTSGLVATHVDGSIKVIGTDLVRIGNVALDAGLPIHELRANENDLEQLFFELTSSEANRNVEGV